MRDRQKDKHTEIDGQTKIVFPQNKFNRSKPEVIITLLICIAQLDKKKNFVILPDNFNYSAMSLK
jgi:hypothetical protein